ncbi:hypothetical protein HPB50_019405 [Hyalomma asiaticum]|uniref:Uncharacterized protein n=1 Tax=Hyalomma asiaticum TaxID=266040 RepID=A0ACB7RN75_HYAAI|nr:hypothetical protein HPB50_019405 [Hyalomma asiaticum]
MARKRRPKRARVIESSSGPIVVSPCADCELRPRGGHEPRLNMAASARAVDPSSWSRMLSIFPGKFSFAFCYGSAAFPQKGVAQTKPWTTRCRGTGKTSKKLEALLLPEYGGPYLVNKVQKDFGAYVYYNTFVPYDDGLMKYGVISTDRLITDLLDWETLYLSGRLHKPVRILQEPTPEIKRAMSLNYMTAIHTALLMLPDVFTEEELYLKIAGLSYVGMTSSSKLVPIVDPEIHLLLVDTGDLGKSYNFFRPVVMGKLSVRSSLRFRQPSQTLEQEPGPDAKLHHLNLLPKSLQSHLLKVWNKDGRHRDLEDVLQAIGNDPHCSGFIEEGLWSAIHYGSKKVIKMLKSLTTTQPSLKT